MLSGQTNATLVLSNVAVANAGEYEVTVTNSVGATSAIASIVVRTMPQVGITEVMSSPSSTPGTATADWWELTSYEQQPVPLTGWRFNDNGGGLTDPFRITNAIVISPGESIIFVEGLTASEFRAWWGESNLPAALQIVSYGGSGLGLGASGDSVRLWDDKTADPADTTASVTFGVATAGYSFSLSPLTGEFGALSEVGVNGSIKAAAANDVGSPGRVSAPPKSPTLQIARSGDTVVISFTAEPGRRYSLQSRSDFVDAEWSPTGDIWMSANAGVGIFTIPLASALRFFRVAVE
jgi:hypothetical protein